MKKRKIFLAAIVVLLGHWGITTVIELNGLMKKYPNEFKQQGDFSFYRFYNTYRTLSYGDIMVKRRYIHHDICFTSDYYIEDKAPNCLKEAKLVNFALNCNETDAITWLTIILHSFLMQPYNIPHRRFTNICKLCRFRSRQSTI